MNRVTDLHQRQQVDVMIVDDHALLAQTLAYALRNEDVRATCCQDLTRDGIVQAADMLAPQLVLLDLELGDQPCDAVPLIAELATRGMQVVLLTGVTSAIRHAECVEAGAVGVIAKSVPFTALVASVQHALRERTLLSNAERQDMLAALRLHRAAVRQKLEPFLQLTPREADVLGALMDGKAAEQIAEERFVSIATVRTQIRTLLFKLDVRSQLSAVALAHKARWVAEREGAQAPATPLGRAS